MEINDNPKNLKRYLDAQETWYIQALLEMKSGRKSGHWMWFIFPQLELGLSPISKYYSIQNKQEALDYLSHPVLGNRLKEITNSLLELKENNPEIIFGPID